MPTRTRSQNEDLSRAVRMEDQNGNLVTSWTFTQTTKAGSSKVTTDVVTPLWLSKLQGGVVLMNPLEIAEVSEDDKVITLDHTVRTSTGALWRRRTGTVSSYYLMGRPVPSLVTLPASPTQNLRDQAIASVFAKASSTDALALVTMAEMQKTADMLVDSVSEMAWLLSLFRRRSYVGSLPRRLSQASKDILSQVGLSARRNPRKVQDLWLRYRYGIRPLVLEIQGYHKALTTLGEKRRFRFTSSRDDVQSKTVLQDKGYEYINLRNVLNRTRTVKVTAGLLLEYELIHSTKSFDAFGCHKILSTAWELTKYSFVADWLANTGDWIASWEPPVGSVVGTWVTELITDTFSASCAEYASSLGSPWQVQLAVQPARYMSMTRTRTRTPNPSRPVTPVWRIKLNKSRIADSMALLGQLRS